MQKSRNILKRNDLFDYVNILLMLGLIIIMLYPFVFIISSSLSAPDLVTRNKIILLPRNITLVNYKYIFSNNNIILSYWNTIKLTVLGTATNVLLTMMTAYPLSRKRFRARRFFMKIITFTMLFSGGLIPTYLVVRTLGLYDTFAAVILTGAINTWNLIIARTFLESIPVALEESAVIDGCNDIQLFSRIFIPLSSAIIATLSLFYAVAHWNSFLGPLIYLNDSKKYPLQILLRSLLIDTNLTEYAGTGPDDQNLVAQSIKYTIIVVATLPILLVYPFLQKYFVKGVMVGSIKG